MWRSVGGGTGEVWVSVEGVGKCVGEVRKRYGGVGKGFGVYGI